MQLFLIGEERIVSIITYSALKTKKTPHNTHLVSALCSTLSPKLTQ